MKSYRVYYPMISIYISIILLYALWCQNVGDRGFRINRGVFEFSGKLNLRVFGYMQSHEYMWLDNCSKLVRCLF